MGDEGAVGWVALQCPGCRARLRLKEAHAHLRGRCPECFYRIDAPRPRPAPAVAPAPEFGDDLDSPGLVPIEEEWPEPARLDADAGQPEGNYTLTQTPQRWPEAPPPTDPKTPATEGYEVARGWTEAPPAPAPELPESYDVGAVPEALSRPDEPILYRLSRAEREPLREPPPPKHPLFEGIFLFPWQAPSNVRVWLLLSLGIGIALVFAIAVHFFFQLIMAGDKAGALLPLPLAALMIIGMITGAYGGSIFLAAAQDTAAGNRDVRWPDDAFFGRFVQFLYLLWLLSCAAWPIGIVFMIEPSLLQRLAFAVPLGLLGVVLFPIFFLSSQAAQKSWVLLHGRLLARLGGHVGDVFFMLFVSTGMAAGCAVLGYFNVVRFEFLLTPVTAGVWAASAIIYARLLGRIAWMCARKK